MLGGAPGECRKTIQGSGSLGRRSPETRAGGRDAGANPISPERATDRVPRRGEVSELVRARRTALDVRGHLETCARVESALEALEQQLAQGAAARLSGPVHH